MATTTDQMERDLTSDQLNSMITVLKEDAHALWQAGNHLEAMNLCRVKQKLEREKSRRTKTILVFY